MAHPEEVKAEVREAVEGSGLVQRLAERMGATARASAVFGDPVERDGVTVIPVARAAWGFGGGGGGEPGREGSGGGGGSLVAPLGYIEIRDGHAEFRSFHDPRTAVLLTVATASLVAVALRALTRR
jgi:uncharacterized spore protein YtfJ